MAAVEGPTGTWRLVDTQDREYGQIELRRVMNGQQIAYKVTVRGEVVGWAHNLRLACRKVHVAYLATMGNPGPAAADWGEKTETVADASGSRTTADSVERRLNAWGRPWVMQVRL